MILNYVLVYVILWIVYAARRRKEMIEKSVIDNSINIISNPVEGEYIESRYVYRKTVIMLLYIWVVKLDVTKVVGIVG